MINDAEIQAPQISWRCFHCDELFADREAAGLHFGVSEQQDPACLIDVKKYREMEALHASYFNEDTLMHREIYCMQAQHALDLRRAEEEGYARGLKDGLQLDRSSTS